MHQIYEMKLWGNNGSDFYSGEGSHNPKIIESYIQEVITFFKSFQVPITVCDLGCGDFNIGKHLVPYTKEYIAVDIVDNLIERNKKLFQNENLQFKCLDIATDYLPDADCVIIRQVLQHLSNKEILAILSKLYKYKYLILTEHIPENDFTPNKDIISGQGIRLKKNSGVNVLESPFNLNISYKKELLRVTPSNNKGEIVTILFGL